MTEESNSQSPRFFIAGNWKMNGSMERLQSFHRVFLGFSLEGCRLALCVPEPLIHAAAKVFFGTPLSVGAQNCHARKSGAFTGETSADLLAECGARYVILGHSERRALCGETDATVREKVKAAIDAELTTILCVGETTSERTAGQHIDVVLGQLEAAIGEAVSCSNTIIAYEPVWAIGSGQSASTNQIEEMHNAIREWSTEHSKPMQILYGGSVNPDSAADIAALENVNGFLVGGASLDPEVFKSVALSAMRR